MGMFTADFIEYLGTATLLLDTNNIIRGCNEQACTELCQTRDQLLGMAFGEIFVRLVNLTGETLKKQGFPLSHADVVERGQIIFGAQPVGLERLQWLRLASGPTLPDLELRTVTLADVTELVGDIQTASQVYQAKNEWETTVDALEDIVTIQDLDMRIVRANKFAHDLFAHELGDLKGKKCYEVFVGRESVCEHCPVRKTGIDGCPHTATIYNYRVDKTFSVSSFPIFDKSGKIYQFVHVARDVTRYLRNEKEKNRLMAAIEQASESVMISDRKGRIQYVNPAFEKISGYSRDVVLGQSTNLLKSGFHNDEFYADMWKILSAGGVWRGRLVNRRKDGTIFREDVTISPVFDEEKQIVNYVALKRDVTREELLEKQLHQAMKMEALGTLAGGIAHDFNNILAAMIGYSEIARDRLSQDHPARPAIGQVLAGGDRAVDLVKQILTFSRRENQGPFQVFKLQYIIKEVIKLLRPSLPATIELRHEIDPSCRSIKADPGQIYQVLMNLCANARQSIGDSHGQILLRLKEIQEESQEGNGNPLPGYLDLEITDTGCGIAREHLDRIFDPFFTTKEKGEGTGLGLAVVHGIIKKHGGEIEVNSEPGGGTTFHVYLRVDGSDEDHNKKKTTANYGKNERIMVVDDEPGLIAVLQVALETNGYRIISFTDPIEAAKAFRRDPSCCDLVLTDMMMPKMTGAELSREMLALRPDIPIIMLTGHGNTFDSEKARKLGIRQYASKPLRRVELLEVVRKVLDHGEYTYN